MDTSNAPAGAPNILQLVPNVIDVVDLVAEERKVLVDALEKFDEAAAKGQAPTHTIVMTVQKYQDPRPAAGYGDYRYLTGWTYSEHMGLLELYGMIQLLLRDIEGASYDD